MSNSLSHQPLLAYLPLSLPPAPPTSPSPPTSCSTLMRRIPDPESAQWRHMQLFLCPRNEEDRGVWLDNYKFLATYKILDTVSVALALIPWQHVTMATCFVGNICIIYIAICNYGNQ